MDYDCVTDYPDRHTREVVSTLVRLNGFESPFVDRCVDVAQRSLLDTSESPGWAVLRTSG